MLLLYENNNNVDIYYNKMIIYNYIWDSMCGFRGWFEVYFW